VSDPDITVLMEAKAEYAKLNDPSSVGDRG
jgi:hypothetical protein